MSGFKVQKLTAVAVVLDDLGLTISGSAGTQYDLTSVPPEDLSRSADLRAAMAALLRVVDPRDDTDTILLNQSESEQAVDRHNDTHFGVSGGRFGPLDDPTVSVTDDYLVRFNSTSGEFEAVSPDTVLTGAQESIEDIVGGMGVNGTDTTFTYDDPGGTIKWDINDSFLRNTGDTLDSGTLTIAEGATLAISGDGGSGGATLTIGQDATATIATPTGGFSGSASLVNKAYVDQVAAALDWKESVRVATTPSDGDITAGLFGGTYAAGAGPSGSGQFTGVDLSSGTGASVDGLFFTGTATTGLLIGNRVLVKDQTDAKQNGVYVIDTGSVAASVILTRAADQDGSPSSEVSGGNTVAAENTTAINASSVNSATSWSVSYDGVLTLNTDDMDWVQVAGPGAIIAGLGLSDYGTTIDIDVDALASVSSGIDSANDTLAFHDASGTPSSSGSQTRKVSFTDLFQDLDVVYDVGSGTGVLVKSADSLDAYTTRSIAVSGAGALDGLAISNGDGVSGNPTIGLDIQNLPATGAVDTVDRIAVWDSTAGANVYYTVGQVAGAVSASDSFKTWSGAGNTSGDATIAADNSADTVTVSGGVGINVALTFSSDTIEWSFARDGMADTAVSGSDTVPFFDASDSDAPEYRSWTDVISDLGLQTSGNTNAYQSIAGGDGGTTATAVGFDTITVNGTGINVTTTNAGAAADTLDLVLDISDLSDGNPGTIVTTDEVAVNDGGTTVRYAWSDVISDLGLLTSSSNFFWSIVDLSGGNNSGDASVAPSTAPDTLNLTAGVGLNANGSDATDTVTLTFGRFGMADTAVTGADSIAFFDASSSNDPEYRSLTNVISDLGILTSGATFYWGSIDTSGNTSGDTTPAADPEIADDTLTFNGGIGITLTGTSGADTISWAFSRAGMADTAVTGADSIAFFDSSNANEPEYRSFSDALGDLDVPHDIGAGTGLVVKTADSPDTYTTRSIGAATGEDLVGLDVTDGDGVSGNPTVGLDIVGLTDPTDEMAATDELPVHDKSEGTGGANRKVTGQNIADGTASILGITGLSFSTINGQSVLTYSDSGRSKTLSVDSHMYPFSDNYVPNNAWVAIGNAVDADSGWIMPLDGTICMATAHCENVPAGNTFDMVLYIDGSSSGTLGTLSAGANSEFTSTTLNVNFSQGDKLRVRASRTAGSDSLGDTTVAVTVRWRA